ncbi:MAG TPA: patatin-like phospholipase family protein [Candidatus Binataceae bacterium]|nr:patatin-like phospholipase family protein [Candidatus Binataceae bacterium]
MANNPRRLAVTIKGGVSLGAYEAGVITEILNIIEYNNTHGGTSWYIDAIAGASAGSITAALLAQILAGNGQTSLLHDAWVSGISLETLASNAQSANTILDSDAVSGLADKYLPSLSQSLSAHAAFNGQSVSLAFTVSGLALDPESLLALNNRLLTWHEYSVVGRFKMLVSQSKSLDYWASPIGIYNHNAPDQGVITGADAYQALKQTAVTSGAFPLAFAPRGLARFEDSLMWRDRWFVDGGVYDNDPVGEMINLAHDVDWSTNAYDDRDRRFLIIEPESLPVAVTFPPTGVNPAALLDVGPAGVLEQILPGLLEQSQESGVRGIAAVNSQINERQNILSDLCSALNTISIDFSTLQRLAGSITDQLARRRKIDQSRLQLFRENFIPDLAALEPDLAERASRLDVPSSGRTNVAGAFVELGLLMDFAADLADKVSFCPIVVSPDTALAGDPMWAFSGFFLADIREHDFQRGRYDAYQALTAIKDPTLILYTGSGVPTDPGVFTPTAAQQAAYNANSETFKNRIDVVVRTLIGEVTKGSLLFEIPLLGTGLDDTISWMVDKVIDEFLKS